MAIADWIEIGRMDELGRMDTPAHRLDARAKALATAAFIVTVMSFPRYTLAALMPLFLYPVVLIALGNLPVSYLLRKVLIAAPFALLIGMFNPLLDRQPVLWVGPLAVSGGWLSFLSILIRFTLTVSAALALLACTGMQRLCVGLDQMGLPRAFVVQLLFLYRYLFVVADEGHRMLRGLAMRTVGPHRLTLRVYASLIGHLLLRSVDRAQRVYRAMVARGFAGEIRVLQRSAPGWRDAVFLCGWVVFFVAVRFRDIPDWLGRWLMRGGA